MNYEQTRQALLRGRELIPVRNQAGAVTHYRFVGTPACVPAETFRTLLAERLMKEVAPGTCWAMSESVADRRVTADAVRPRSVAAFMTP
jgi:predicted MFS family arabinose efflux permease